MNALQLRYLSLLAKNRYNELIARQDHLESSSLTLNEAEENELNLLSDLIANVLDPSAVYTPEFPYLRD